MKRNLFICIIIIFLFSCVNENKERINYLNYRLGEKYNSDWLVKNKDDEKNFKFLVNKNDSNIICRCVADTVWNIMILNICEEQKDSLIQSYNNILNSSYDSIYNSNTTGGFEFFELKWIDKKNQDIITLTKIRMSEDTEFGDWILEIRNDSLLNQLDQNHNPFYNLPFYK